MRVLYHTYHESVEYPAILAPPLSPFRRPTRSNSCLHFFEKWIKISEKRDVLPILEVYVDRFRLDFFSFVLLLSAARKEPK